MTELPNDEYFKSVVRNWVKLLSEKRFSDAAKALEPKPLSIMDSAEEIKIAIGLYSWDFTRLYEAGKIVESMIPNVNDPFSMLDKGEGGHKEQFYISHDFDAEGSVKVLYDLPINGVWSDLSAEFLFTPKGEVYRMTLLDIRVM